MYDQYAALIFDCDGTLVDSLYAHESAWIQTLNFYQIPFTPARMNQLGGVPTDKTIEALATDAGLKVDVPRVTRHKEKLFLSLIFDHIAPVAPVVSIARQHHGRLPLGVGTGSDTRVARMMLEALGIDDLFDAVVGADMVKRHKPEPDTYLETARLLRVRPEDCCVFEDADGGIVAARSAGMQVVDVRHIWQPEDRLFTA